MNRPIECNAVHAKISKGTDLQLYYMAAFMTAGDPYAQLSGTGPCNPALLPRQLGLEFSQPCFFSERSREGIS